jgi:N-acetylglucosamine-6-sulfatase
MRLLPPALASLLILLVAAPAQAATKKPATKERPNVVVVMTDDQDFRSMGVMPKTRKLIGARGTTFDQNIVNFPLCCPSRATYYSGQYSHNHKVLWNNPPQGGYDKFKGKETLPVWLSRAGYRTIHIGKYLNEYGQRRPKEVPPGWQDWYGGVDPTTYDYYGFTINHNGKLKTYGRTPKDYSTDVYTGLAEEAIRTASKKAQPFFMSLAPNAPHTVATQSGATKEGSPALAPPRYANVFANALMPRFPNFNPDNIDNKPAIKAFFPNKLSDLEVSQLQDHWRGRMGALLGVDDMVERLVNVLKKTGEYDNTVIVYTSDNGWILGEHRLRDPVTEDGKAAGVKYVPYEGSARVPLIVAGPGFPAGRVVTGVTSNADLSPTILQLAGATPKLTQDGESLLDAANDPSKLHDRGVLIETFDNPRGVPPYSAIRTDRYRYEKQKGGEVEGLYDLALDPWELQSLDKDPRYAKIKAILKAQLSKLDTCKGASCRAPVPALPAPGQ